MDQSFTPWRAPTSIWRGGGTELSASCSVCLQGDWDCGWGVNVSGEGVGLGLGLGAPGSRDPMLPAGLGLPLCSQWLAHLLLASFQEETPKGPLSWLREQESCCGPQMARGLAPLRRLKCRFHPQAHPWAVSRSLHPRNPGGAWEGCTFLVTRSSIQEPGP